MNSALLPFTVRAQTAWGELRTRIAAAWDDRADETGVDEAVTKMIWLAVGIGAAVTATTLFLDVFETATSNVPDPVVPAP